jgi:hypothetical protein
MACGWLRKNELLLALCIRIACCLIAGAMCVGCDGGGPPEPQPKDIQSAFGLDAGRAGGEIKSVELYLDGSGSMRGFLGGGEQYVGLLRNLVTNVRSSLAPLQCFKFGAGDPVQIDESDCWEAVRSASFYGQGETRLDRVIGQISTRRDPSTLFLIVTDGIQAQSARGYNALTLASEVSGWVGKGGSVELVGFRASFHGKVYSEMRPGVWFKYDSTEGREETYRPFYVFVFAPTPHELETFNLVLRPSQGELNGRVFNPSSFGFNNRALRIPLEQFGGDFDLYREDRIITDASSIPVLYATWRGPYRENKLGALKTLLDLDMNPDVEGRFNAPSDLGTTASVKVYGKDGFEEAPFRRLPESHRCDPGEDRLRRCFDITWSFVRPHEQDWCVYHIVIFPSQGSMEPPEWVNNWSTDRDFERKSATKTLYLSTLVRVLINTVTIREPIAEHFIVIGGNRE